jgi:polyisoprenyl-teichoic acid--peptidoglycan teichoic acid transferase
VVASLPPWRAFVRRYVIALGVTFVLVTSALFVGNRVIDDKISDIPRINGLVLPDGPGEAGNFLVIGSDSRSGLDASHFGTESETGPPKSDTLMVIHVDPESKKSLLVSFPRDLKVDVPGHGEALINSAFNEGPQKVIDTLKDNFQIPINHYVEINFTAFTGIVDAVGKIPVYFPAPARDDYSGLNITTPGCVQLDGNQALEYARSRHLQYYDAQTGEWNDASPRADLDRITRQQSFIRKLADVAARKSGSNPLTALDVADAIIPKLHFDESLSKTDIFQLVNTFRKVNPNDDSAVEMVTMPVEDAGDGAHLKLKQPDADAVLSRLRTFGVPKGDFAKLIPAQVRVRVLNGSGVEGAAGQALAGFQRYSFAPAGTGNTDAIDSTEIHYRPGNENKALLVASYMQGVGHVVADTDISDADVVVKIATDFTGVKAPSKHGSKTTTTTTAPASTGSTGSGATTKTTAPAASC